MCDTVDLDSHVTYFFHTPRIHDRQGRKMSKTVLILRGLALKDVSAEPLGAHISV